MYGMLLSYGPDIQVLEPLYVAEKIRDLAKQIYNNHQAATIVVDEE
jgi:predicted DNA-binding transcriptional regulator YafY